MEKTLSQNTASKGDPSANGAGGALGEVKITVRDTGVGIPKEKLPHIFDRFYQVDSAATREYEGTGIGLAITMELVQLHGGGISVDSTEGFGTTFVVSLPLGHEHLKPEQMAEEELTPADKLRQPTHLRREGEKVEFPSCIEAKAAPETTVTGNGSHC